MAELDVKIRQKSVDGIDTLYPKTKAENVSMDETGGTVKDYVVDTTTNLSNLSDTITNMRTNDIEARREILDIKKRLDSLDIIDFLDKTGIGFFELFKDLENIDAVSSTASINTSLKQANFVNEKLLKMNEQTFATYKNLELSIYDKNRVNHLVVENTTTSTLKVFAEPNTVKVGDKYFHNGETYTVQSVV